MTAARTSRRRRTAILQPDRPPGPWPLALSRTRRTETRFRRCRRTEAKRRRTGASRGGRSCARALDPSDDQVEGHGCEEQREVEEREVEEEHGAPRCRVAAESLREPDEDRAERERGREVEQADRAPRPRQHRDRHEPERVEDDLACGLPL